MLTDIHGVDPTQFRANLGEHPSRDSSRKKKKKHCKHAGEVEEGTRESEAGEDGLELRHDASVGHLDFQA